MSRKVRGASALTLVAMLGITLFGIEGTRAKAEMGEVAIVASEMPVTEAVDAADASSEDAQATGPRFVSNPVVQAVPETPTTEDKKANMIAASNLKDFLAGLPVPDSLDKELTCLAGAIYHESKGEPLDGQLAVARVVVARAASPKFPSSYCGVVYQRHQFSFVRGGAMPRINKASRAWQRAKKLAMIADKDEWSSEAEGALYFHANYVNPRWSKKMTRLAQIDNHIFYR
ncbi:cell wall hydrolase [Croceicoccus mobilis]|uniref:Cell wall hydrolase SleB domain-containing protein n=1 Tax=Croceicoccus mobilis TaxID=1703339 RepID=A0A916YUE9_9SPHN|nr:cell wall hydrolase [Croceicoccus mobilis]GGD60189.1 hypothetical protein GCM10010990_07040 [Croceicoccus mobilis]